MAARDDTMMQIHTKTTMGVVFEANRGPLWRSPGMEEGIARSQLRPLALA